MTTKHGLPTKKMTIESKIMYLALDEPPTNGIRISYDDEACLFSVHCHHEEFMSADLEAAIDLAVDFINEIVDSVVDDVLKEAANERN